MQIVEKEKAKESNEGRPKPIEVATEPVEPVDVGSFEVSETVDQASDAGVLGVLDPPAPKGKGEWGIKIG